jgi:hypothetical protein
VSSARWLIHEDRRRIGICEQIRQELFPVQQQACTNDAADMFVFLHTMSGRLH